MSVFFFFLTKTETVSLATRKCPVRVMGSAPSSLAVAWIQCPTLAAERRKEPAKPGSQN